MSPFKALFERMQHNIDQLGDALSGSHGAERVLQADMDALQAELRDWRARAAEMKAQRITRNEHLRELAASMRSTEADALAALRAGRKTTARSLAERIARLQADKAEDTRHRDALLAQEKALLALIDQGEQKLRRLRHQLDTLRASQCLQRAQTIVAHRQPGSAPHPETAVASAQRHKPAEPPAAPPHPDATPAPDPSQTDAVLLKLAKRLASEDAGASSPSRPTARRRP